MAGSDDGREVEGKGGGVEGGMQAWYLPDITLGLPKSHCYLHLVTPEAYQASPEGYVISRLYCRLLEDLLEPETYYAQLASTSYSLSCTETGLVLHLQV